jgi:apoptosis-inducing factor 2
MDFRRVVIAGLGDSGVLTPIRLARHAEVVGISAKPALVSGQELGWRLSRPHDWARANWIPFDRFRGLARVRTVHGILTGLDLSARVLFVRHDDGSTSAEGYDALIISTGVTNGFWRQPNFQLADAAVAGWRSPTPVEARTGLIPANRRSVSAIGIKALTSLFKPLDRHSEAPIRPTKASERQGSNTTRQRQKKAPK